jgi:hypothetical protein
MSGVAPVRPILLVLLDLCLPKIDVLEHARRHAIGKQMPTPFPRSSTGGP